MATLCPHNSMLLQETILCSTSNPSSPPPGLIAVHDIQTGATLASFKQTNSKVHCVAVLESRFLQGGIILASQPEKSIMNVYDFQKDQINMKIVLPEKLSCIALDKQGALCAGGTAAGRIYLWETASGILYNAWDAHYRQVNVLHFTDDGAALVSGSDDSTMNVWSVSRLLDDEMQNENLLPYGTFSDHTLPITDMACGVGHFPECRLLTASRDHTVKLWDLSSRSLLTTFQFPKPISCLAWDIAERFFFAASPDGSIYQVNLFREKQTDFGSITEAVGGAGITDVITIETEIGQKRRLILVEQPLTCICTSLTSSILLVGTSDGLIHLYDIPSHQLLRSISTHQGMSISHIQTMVKPPDLVGHVSLEIRAGLEAKDVIPVKPVLPFQKIRDAKAREAHEVTVIWPQAKSRRDASLDYTTEELLRDQAFFLQPPLSSEQAGRTDPTSLKSRVTELEAEIQTLQDQLVKAKSINDSMWDVLVQKCIPGQSLEETEDAGDGDETDQRKRKRGRA